MRNRVLNPQEAPSAARWIPYGVALTLAVAAFDYLTGPELSASFFYFAGIAVVAWYGSLTGALLIALLSAALWMLADRASGHAYSMASIVYWNAGVRLATFMLVAYLLHALAERLRRAEELARTDPLTGASNHLAFYERVHAELERAQRYQRPFTIAYIDLDDFKAINDERGHAVGDQVLCAVADTLRAGLRQTDIVARLGGDEFAALLVETGYDAATEALKKLKTRLDAHGEHHAPWVSVSIGAVTFESVPRGVPETIKMADRQMYLVKARGKDGIAHTRWSEKAPEQCSQAGDG